MSLLAQQGHRYLWCGVDEVLALESGTQVRVALLEPDALWFKRTYPVDAADLTPMPMRYFGDRIP